MPRLRMGLNESVLQSARNGRYQTHLEERRYARHKDQAHLSELRGALCALGDKHRLLVGAD